MEQESIQDLLDLNKLKPRRNAFKRKPKIKLDTTANINKTETTKNLELRISKLENEVEKLKKLTKYLDYVRSITANKK